jgi:hypothetical protein
MMGMIMAGSPFDQTTKREDQTTRKSDKELKLQKGLKVFTIEGKEITALNRKNAIKKFNKMKL